MTCSERPVKITRKAFTAWLRKQPADRYFKPRSSCSCPLAQFLRETTNDDSIQVCTDVYYLQGTLGQPLPEWARRFISAFDAATVSADTVVTLDVLRRV